MAIKFNAKDTDELEVELEEWAAGMNLFSTTASSDVITVSVDDVKKSNTKRTSYVNETLSDQPDAFKQKKSKK